MESIGWQLLNEAVEAATILWVQECDDFLSQWFGWHPIVGVVGYPLWPVRAVCE